MKWGNRRAIASTFGVLALTLALFELVLQAHGRLTGRVVYRLGETDDRFWQQHFREKYERGNTEFELLHAWHPTRGWTLRPNLSVVYQGVRYTTNEAGQRSLFPASCSDDRLRVAILGDSFTFGSEVDDEQTWTHWLQQRLPEIHVINLGVGGYATDQMLITLQETIARDRPHLVLAAVFSGDLKRSMLRFRDYKKPYFAVEDGELRLMNTPIGAPTEVAAELRAAERRLTLRSPEAFARLLGWDAFNLPQCLELNEKIFDAMLDCCRTHGAELMLAHLAAGRSIHQPSYDDYGERFLEAFAERHELMLVKTRARFLRETGWAPFHYLVRETPIVADLVAEGIRRTTTWQGRHKPVEKLAAPARGPLRR